MNTTVSLQAAYDEACRALGAATVREKFLMDEIDRLAAENAALRAAAPAPDDHAL